MQEFELISKFFKQLTKGFLGAQNLADDVAKIALKPDEELVISKDVFVEDVHFFADEDPKKISSKLLLTNLSDIASSGAKPLYYMLGFGKSKKFTSQFYTKFVSGLKEIQEKFAICLIGGDTASAAKSFFSVTIFGVAKKGKILSRLNAKDGDLIFVSGSIGDSAIGFKVRSGELKIQNKNEKNFFLNRHFFPEARIELGKKLIEKNLSKCATDVSDGLFADLRNICNSSNLDAEIFLDAVPISDLMKKFLEKNPNQNILDLLSFGDDYELIFTANLKDEKKIFALSKELNLNISCIGKMTKKTKKLPKLRLFNSLGKRIKIKKFGYEH